LQGRTMGRGHAAAHRSHRSRAGASGRTFDRRYHCASTRGRSLRSCRVPRPRRNFDAARRAISQAVRFPPASAGPAGWFPWAQRVPEHAQEIAAARIDALLTYDAGERLRSIRNPTLLIAAVDDLLVPWQLSESIAEEIAHAHLVKLDHGGHRFPQTRVEAYNTLLLEFFRTHSERDARKRTSYLTAQANCLTRHACQNRSN